MRIIKTKVRNRVSDRVGLRVKRLLYQGLRNVGIEFLDVVGRKGVGGKNGSWDKR